MSMEISGPFSEVERGSEKAADFVYAGGKNVLTGIPGEGGEVWNMSGRTVERNRVTELPVPDNPEVLFTYDKAGYTFQPVEDGSGRAYAHMADSGLLCVDVQNHEVVYDLPAPTGSDGNPYGGSEAGLIQEGRWYLSNNWYGTVEEELVINSDDGSVSAWWHNAGITYSYASSPLPVNGLIFYETQDPDYNTKGVAVDPSDGSVQWEVTASDGLRTFGGAGYHWAHDPGTGYLVTTNGYGGIHRIDPSDGSMVGDSTEMSADIWNITVSQGIAYGCDDAAFGAIDIETGDVVWERSVSTTGTPQGPAIHDGMLYYSARDWQGGGDAMIALDASDGSTVWVSEVMDFGTWTGGSVLYSIADDVVISPTDDTNMLYALNGSDGSTVWSLGVNSNRGYCIPMNGKLVTASGNFDVIGDP